VPPKHKVGGSNPSGRAIPLEVPPEVVVHFLDAGSVAGKDRAEIDFLRLKQMRPQRRLRRGNFQATAAAGLGLRNVPRILTRNSLKRSLLFTTLSYAIIG
jgi:hypothetical protein